MPATNMKDVAVAAVLLTGTPPLLKAAIEQPSWLAYVFSGLAIGVPGGGPPGELVLSVLSLVVSQTGVTTEPWNGMSPRLVTLPFLMTGRTMQSVEVFGGRI